MSTLWTAITLEGVLARPSDDLASAPPQVEGTLLYRTLAPTGQLIVLCDNRDPRLVSHWLNSNFLTGHIRLVLGIEGLPPGMPTRLRQVARLRAGGLALRLVIDSDPVVAEHLANDGVSAASLFTPVGQGSRRAPRSFLPRAWDDMMI